MKAGFLETMKGSLTTTNGAALTHDVEFTIKTEAQSLRQLLKDGRTRADGIVRAAPWAAAAPCAGELSMSLSLARIAYRLSFRADNGTALVLGGHKTPSLLHPIDGMTILPMTLSGIDGVEHARGTLTFSLGDLPTFLASWLHFLPAPRAARGALDVERVALRRRVLEA